MTQAMSPACECGQLIMPSLKKKVGSSSGKTDIVVDIQVFCKRITAIARLRAGVWNENGVVQVRQVGCARHSVLMDLESGFC